MNIDVINIALALFEGFALIISPCILPILPIILSGSLTGSRARPVGIIAGFVVVFSIVVLFSRALVNYVHINPTYLRTAAFVILLLLGLVMLSSYLTEKFNQLSNRLTNVGQSVQMANNPRSGFWGGFVFGGMVGIIWTPCAGPILAAVIVQVAIQQTTVSGVLTIIAFAIGAGIPMLLIALAGRSMMQTFSFFRTRAVVCRKLLGAVIIASVAYLIYDSGMVTTYAQSNTKNTNTTSLVNGLMIPYKAPSIDGIDAWINSQPIQLSQLKGKVVLIDFWTYSCINCIRTLPYLLHWYERYHNKGFEIIGVHTPEFEFEKNLQNVQQAVKKFGITYPVALDNNYVTWRNFNNHYWPAHFLINQQGEVVYEHFGEGEYEVTENNIRYLLGIKENVITTAEKEHAIFGITPETYLGYERSDRLANLQIPLKNKAQEFEYPTVLPQDSWALQGKWIIYPDKIVSVSAGSAVKLHFNAANVYAVMGAPLHSVKLTIRLNDKLVTNEKGNDVTNSEVIVSGTRLYSLIQLKQAGEGTVELMAESPGVEIYTFTFGE